MPRQMRGTENVAGQMLPRIHEWREQFPDRLLVRAEPSSRFVQRMRDYDRRSIVERMSQRGFWIYPTHAQILERKTLHKRRCYCQWMDGRTHVVYESGKR